MLDLKKWFFWFWTRNYKLSFLVFFLLLFTWIFSAYTIPKESSPDIKFWMILISVPYTWVSPTDIDNLISEKVDNAIKDIDWIKKVTQVSGVWISQTTVELFNWVDTRIALVDIKDAIDSLDLPDDALDPIVKEISTMNELMFQALIYWDKNKFDDFTINTLAQKIEKQLAWKKWIVSIDIWSSIDRRMWIWSSSENNYEIKVLISKEKMELLGLSINEISSKIKAYNKNMPIWNYTIWDLNYDFRFEGEFSKLEELENVIIKDNWYSKLLLKDIAEFKKEFPWKSINNLWFYKDSWYNYVSLSFNKKAWDSIFKVSKDAKELLENLLKWNPEFEWLKIKYSNDLSEIIKQDYKDLWKSWLTTLVLVFLIITFFVWIRESIITSILLPLAFLITFMVIDMLWLSMNFLTNFSLVLSLWIAIDTIIVIIEWADERQKLWYGRESAVLLAIRDLKSPLISWTATTLVAFIPMIFLPWLIWKFLAYIPITVFCVLLAALILSLTLSSPFFTKLAKRSRIFHIDEDYEKRLSDEEKELLIFERLWKKEVNLETEWIRLSLLSKLRKWYYNTLKWYMVHKKLRIISIFLPTILLILTFIFLSPKIGFTLFPTTDEWAIDITIEAKTWTDKDSLKWHLSKIDEFLSKYEEMKVFYTSISWNKINLSIELTDAKERQRDWKKSVFEIEKMITKDLKYFESIGLKVSVEALKWWPPTTSPVWIKLIVDDNKKIWILRDVAKEFENYLKTIPWTKNVWMSSSDNPGQFIFRFDKEKLSFLWLTPNDILWEVYFYTNWIKSWTIKWEYDNDIILKISDFDKSLSPVDISNLLINTRVWKIRVWDVATYIFEPALSSINREDWNITISVNSDLETWYLPTSIQPKLVSFASKYNFPDWVSYIEWWENAENADLIMSTVKSFVIAVFLIFAILVLQFGSYSQSLMILYTVVLALLWVNIWLFVTWNPYSMPFAIWFIALTWVVVNDAIILISTINNNISRFMEHWETQLSENDLLESILMAWKNRLQPIIVTTLTTVIWILPLALQDEFWAGLWFTIVFWLVAWSFMTLFIIPSIYYTFYYKRYVK